MKKNVLIVGPILTQSGYGEHARMIYRALKSRGDLFEIFINPVKWGSTSWMAENNEERGEIDQIIQKTYQHIRAQRPFDTTVMITIPPEWKDYRASAENIGVCAGIESDRVSPHWLEAANLFVDKVIVPSEFSKNTFTEARWDVKDQGGNDITLMMSKPVDVVHYPVEKEFINPSKILHKKLKLKHDFNFLCVAQWGPRKNILNTIRYFLDEFGDDEVGLLLKLSIKDGSTIDYYETKDKIKNILNDYPERKCSVKLIHGYLTKEELSSLYTHPRVKCLLNFGHGEGYGLPLFEAAAVGLPIITHDWGGQKDFLYALKKDKKGNEKLRAHFTKISYDLKEIQQEAVWDGVLQPETRWAFPHGGGCKIAMRQCYENYGLFSGQAKRLKESILNNFKEDEIYKKVVDSIFGYDVDEFEDWISEINETEFIE